MQDRYIHWRSTSYRGDTITNTTHSVARERRNNSSFNQKINFSAGTFPELVITSSTTWHKYKLWYLTCKEKIYFPSDIPDVNLQVRCSFYTSERCIDSANGLFETDRCCETCYLGFWSNTQETVDTVTKKVMYYDTLEDLKFDLWNMPYTFWCEICYEPQFTVHTNDATKLQIWPDRHDFLSGRYIAERAIYSISPHQTTRLKGSTIFCYFVSCEILL